MPNLDMDKYGFSNKIAKNISRPGDIFVWGKLTVELEARDWIFAGCLDGWIKTKDDTDNDRDGTGNTEDFPWDMWRKWSDERDKEGAEVA